MTTVVAAQVSLSIGDLDGNRAACLDAIAAAADGGAQLVVLPELSDTGYVFADRAEAAALADFDTTQQGWIEAARATGVVVVGGLCELDGETLYNSALLVDATGVRAHYRKVHLWDREQEIFTPGGDGPPVVDTSIGRIAVMVCYDLEFPEWVRLAATAGADVIAAPVNWPSPDQRDRERPIEVIKAQAGAATYGVNIVVADRCGTERGCGWIGGSTVIDRAGSVVAGPAGADHEGLMVADLELTDARDKRLGASNHLFSDRRPELYGELAPPPP
jgi:predicted amidohydrolase